MLYILSQKIQNSRVFMTLLFCIFLSCWAHNAWSGKSFSQLSIAAAQAETAESLSQADTYNSNHTSQTGLSQSAKADSCDKTSCLLKQVQLDLPDILPFLIIVLVLLGTTYHVQLPLKLKPQWRPKRRTPSLFCCFLE